MKFMRFISKQKGFIFMVSSFVFSAIIYVLFITNTFIPRYQSLSELNYIPYLMMALTIIFLGITHAIAEYKLYQKYRSIRYLLVGSMMSLMILVGATLKMYSYLMYTIYVPEPAPDADIQTLNAFLIIKNEIYQRGQPYDMASSCLLWIGFTGIIFGRSLLGNNKVKEISDSDEQSDL